MNPCHTTEKYFSSWGSWERIVEPKLSRPFSHYVLNAIETHVDNGSAWADATTESGGGCGRLGQNEKGICEWQDVSRDDHSLIQDWYATPNLLNKVGEETSRNSAKKASGSDFSQVGVLDFAQDMTFNMAGR